MLGSGRPSVAALSRVQTAVGTMRFSLDTSDRLSLTCVYETSDGATVAVRPGDTTPVPTVAQTPSGHIVINLRRIEHIQRLLIVIRAASPETRWAGVVTATLGGKTRVQFPIEAPIAHESLALATGFVVDGRLAVRAEQDHVDIPLRGMCERYGYTQIAWRDDRTPINSI
ncbi:hypothetical protein ABEG17_06525 [Pedococcus sp. KACC 23699]|uniref:Uncharacterized protein n=1 Tax=Pedococcus sp. KACC 23699 TaxID=3149228 RepID=A0AAU7JY27_9MICO